MPRVQFLASESSPNATMTAPTLSRAVVDQGIAAIEAAAADALEVRDRYSEVPSAE
ncbi:MAG: hypothetical protein O3A10_14260 [Chloroflexi bacterium]|nr:hypothetical protein [Chloroflexota bacterium]MDA1148302.1 hypothetical protein [Chloroflexota bacterium]